MSDFETERLKFEREMRERELEQQRLENESSHQIELDRLRLERDRLDQQKKPNVPWNTAAGVAIIGGLITLLSAVASNFFEGLRTSDIEKQKFQTDLISKSIERAESNIDAAINLNFLWETGLIPDFPGIKEFVTSTELLPDSSAERLPSAKTYSQARRPPVTSSKIDQVVKIGSWNVRNLGRADTENNELVRARSIANYIMLSGMDILAIQEIYIADVDQRSNKELDEAFGLLNQVAGNAWEYIVFPNRRSADKTQLVGIAWNSTRVWPVAEPFKIPVEHNQDGFGAWDRAPHAMKFSTGADTTDFVVINVHMKSNFRGSTEGAERRKIEAEELKAHLGKVQAQFSDKDIIILGDMNTLKGSETAVQTLLEAGFRDLNANDLATYIARTGTDYGTLALDRILVPLEQPEFLDSRQYGINVSDSQEFRDQVSDHLLILTSIKVSKDDD